MYEGLRLLMRTQRREERVELDEDAEAGQRVVREEDEMRVEREEGRQ